MKFIRQYFLKDLAKSLSNFVHDIREDYFGKPKLLNCKTAYPTSEVPNKHAFDGLFCSVVFPFFGTSKDLIRDLQRLQFFNF